MNPVEILVAATSMVAVVISLLTATSASRQGAFEDLKIVVAELKEQLNHEQAERKALQIELDGVRKEMITVQRELSVERIRRIRIESWAYQLSRQLEENKIIPAPYPADASLDTSNLI